MMNQTERLSQEALNTVIVDINKAILASKKSSSTIFSLLKDARKLNADDYELVRDRIDLDKSTISKIEKIFKNSLVMTNLENLPIAWGTLYELALMSSEMLLANIKSGKINSKTTKSDAIAIRKAPAINNDVDNSETYGDDTDNSEIDGDDTTTSGKGSSPVKSEIIVKDASKKDNSIIKFTVSLEGETAIYRSEIQKLLEKTIRKFEKNRLKPLVALLDEAA
jgi:hypothetical protein